MASGGPVKGMIGRVNLAKCHRVAEVAIVYPSALYMVFDVGCVGYGVAKSGTKALKKAWGNYFPISKYVVPENEVPVPTNAEISVSLVELGKVMSQMNSLITYMALSFSLSQRPHYTFDPSKIVGTPYSEELFEILGKKK